MVDHIQDVNKHTTAWSIVKPAGNYFVTGSTGGDGNMTEPNLFVYAPGVPGAPALQPAWVGTTAGYTLDMDVLVQNETSFQVLTANGGEDVNGEGGNGGNALWLQFTVE